MDAIKQRSRELLAYAAQQKADHPAQSPGHPHTEDLGEVGLEELLASELRDLEHLLEDDSLGSEEEPPADPALPTLAEPALHGLAGNIVRSLAPHTEADPVAILLQLLTAFGNLVGSAPHALVGPTRHGLNLFVILVGESSKARKGTSWRQIAGLFAEADPGWYVRRVVTTRPTPGYILQALGQPSPSGQQDHRLLLLAEEFASILHLLGRQTGQLSPLLRSAWDGGDISASNGHRLLHIAGAHISLVGHITQGELAQQLSHIDAHNGFANRCLWASVRRSQSLPEGGSNTPDPSHARELRRAFEWAQSQNTLLFRRTEAARALWKEHYPTLSQGRPDQYGAATSRAEAQVLRLSTIYAALDLSPVVEACHLQAALAVWNYCQASAALFFDGSPVDPIASRINRAIDAAPGGLSRTQIRRLFGTRVTNERIGLALDQLASLGLIKHNVAVASGPGRHATLWTNTENCQTGN